MGWMAETAAAAVVVVVVVVVAVAVVQAVAASGIGTGSAFDAGVPVGAGVVPTAAAGVPAPVAEWHRQTPLH